MSLESDLPVVSDDPWLHEMAYRLLGSEYIITKLDCDPHHRSGRLSHLQRLTLQRHAILDECAFTDLYRPGLDWLPIADLLDNLAMTMNPDFVEDLLSLRGIGLIATRWTIGELPDTWRPTIRVVRLREAILRNPRHASYGDPDMIARESGLGKENIFRWIRRMDSVSYDITLTSAGLHLVNPNG